MENPPTPPVRPDEPSSGPVPNRSKMRRAIVWVVVLLVFAGLFLLVLRTQNTPQAAAQMGKRGATSGAVSVIPATAQKSNIGVYLEAIGTVTPVYTSSVTSQVTGLVMAVHYREGQLVHKGEALIDIDPRPFQAKLAQARRHAGKRHADAGAGHHGPGALSRGVGPEWDCQANPRRPGKDRFAVPGTGEVRSGHGAI